MRRLAHLPLVLAALTFGLVTAAPAGAWDDAHMRSNFARQTGPAPPRPPVRGHSRYEQILEEPAPASPTGVAETTLELSPHGWKPGGPSGARTAAPLWASGRHGLGSARPRASSGVRRNTLGSRRSQR